MDENTRTHFDNLHTKDKDAQNDAYYALMTATDQPVDWAYEVWDGLVTDLSHANNHVRAIASQLLCNLAKSDPENRILTDFETLLNVTRDERFVTARHCLQALWKIGIVGNAQRDLLITGLERRYNDCIDEKNYTLIRHDIIQSLRNVYDNVHDDAIKTRAFALIKTETDPKYRKKYTTVWKDVK
ncbi:MAG: hypothetical protein RLP44_30915 [Aggregatilineales bacterium]